jgi:chromosome segregation ATPase
MKLIALQIVGVGELAWSSRRLVFGDRITQLYGDNGSGKTPVVQSIAFALGYNVEYHIDILERADRVVLEVLVDGEPYVITRRIKSSFSVTVEKITGELAEFISEREFSRFLLTLWGLDDPVLTTVRDVSTHIYSPQLLPLFYLDQNHGYAVDYYTTSRFIKNQYAEAMRLVFGLAPKHSFDKRRARSELKEKLEYLDRAVIRLERQISELTEDLLGSPRRSVIEIDGDLELAKTALEELRRTQGGVQQIDVALENRIAQLQQQSHSLLREKSELETRVRGFSQIRHEIEVEADTLSLNEEARRVFASFEAICANVGCGLFLRSSQTYGKSLLYLRDQIKDLERTNDTHRLRLKLLGEQLALLHDNISMAQAERERASADATVGSLVEVVSELTERVIHLRRSKQIEIELSKVESAYVEKLEERVKAQRRLAEIEGGGGTADLDLLQVRNALTERVKFWLGILRSSNVSWDIHVDNDFNVTFGGQKISAYNGSTMTRVVLAIRTAAFELICKRNASAPRFFVLDTPRQQDIARADLAAYIEQLQTLGSEYHAQIILSTTNHRYSLEEGDVEWVPDFPGEKHPMFLGAHASTDVLIKI